MAKKTRSIKGVMVDFDLLRIKQQIAQNPAPVNVQEREAFIDKKVRRRARKKTHKVNLDVVDDTIVPEEDIVEEDVVDDIGDNQADDIVPTTRTVKKQRKD